MNYLTAEDLSKSYGTKMLFEKIAFGITKGQRIGFIAKNGTGKTSLLNILSDLDKPDTGKVSQRKGLRIGLLSQDPQLPAESTPEQVLFAADNEQIQAVRLYEKALQNPEESDALQEALDNMDRLNAWEVEVNIQTILGKLNLAGLNRKIGQLSGGQKKRLALAQLLIEAPDLLIMDEPTNHLDLDMIEWLENYMNNEQMTLFMVTHDRYFLDGVCNEIWELEGGKLFQYKGKYAYYLEKKQMRMENEQSSVDKAKNLMRTELEWMRRQPKARGTKSKARIDSFYDLKSEAGKKLDSKSVELEIKMSRLGSKIVEVHKLKKAFGDQLISNGFDYTFKGGERLGVIGKNGVGKSTFLNMLMDLEQPDSGKIVRGDTVVFGYYTQSGMNIPDNKRVIDVVKDVAEIIPLGKGRKLTASQLLDRFLFEGDQQYSLVSKLS
ncbi:MAG: ATP-binding cassette subfamily F protein uup, partial [Flavobacteriales bacterium]